MPDSHRVFELGPLKWGTRPAVGKQDQWKRAGTWWLVDMHDQVHGIRTYGDANLLDIGLDP